MQRHAREQLEASIIVIILNHRDLNIDLFRGFLPIEASVYQLYELVLVFWVISRPDKDIYLDQAPTKGFTHIKLALESKVLVFSWISQVLYLYISKPCCHRLLGTSFPDTLSLQIPKFKLVLYQFSNFFVLNFGVLVTIL